MHNIHATIVNETRALIFYNIFDICEINYIKASFFY